MTDLPTDLTPLILNGHVVDVLRALPERSVQCVVTSPPYWGLRAYGTEPQVWAENDGHQHEWSPTQPRREWQESMIQPGSKQGTNRGSVEHIHAFSPTFPRRPRREADATTEVESASVGGRNYDAQGGGSCACGAWRGELGSEPTPELYVEHLALVFAEVHRVLRDDGTLWLNLGDTYTTHPAGLTGLKRWKATGLNNRDHTAAEQAGSFDKRGAKIPPREHPDMPPVPTGPSGPHGVENLPEKNLVGIPWRVAFRLQADGWFLRAENIWAKPNPMPESIRDRPTRAHEQVFLLTKSARYFYDADAVREVNSPEYVEPKEVTRGSTKATFFEQSGLRTGNAMAYNGLGRNLRSVWWIATEPYPEAHFATFPTALAETCIKAGTSEKGACAACVAPLVRVVNYKSTRQVVAEHGTTVGVGSKHKAAKEAGWRNDSLDFGNSHTYFQGPQRDTVGWKPGCDCAAEVAPCLVLDPFAGSGTVLLVARSLGRRSVGIELNPKYAALARRRSAADTPDLESFAPAVAPP